MFTDRERILRIQEMVDEIEYRVTQPHFPDREHDLCYALEVMTKSVGLFTKGDEAPHNLELIENNIAQVYNLLVRARSEHDFVKMPDHLVSS